jgi:CPA2 family monovalent cation:H+ antiporter-2
MATAYVLVMAVVGPLAARYAEPLLELVLPSKDVVTRA